MASPEGAGAQSTLAEKLQKVYVFKPGPYPIYPASGWPGAPTEIIEAVRTGKKVRGLTGFCSTTTIHLFHRGEDGKEHYWQRSKGTKFGAYTDKVELKEETE